MKKEKLTKFSDIVYYYKWYMIITALVILAVAYIAVECHNKVEDDLIVTAVLSNYPLSTASDEIAEDMVADGIIPDLNEDGVSKPYVNMITFPLTPQSQEEMMAGQLVSIAFAEKKAVLFLIDLDLLEMYEDDEIFCDISRVAELHDIPDEDLYIAEDGTIMGISLAGNEYLESKGIPTQTLYACYKYLPYANTPEENQVMLDAADEILAYIMK